MVGRAGLGLVAELADRSGLSRELSDAVRGVRRWAEHDPGKVLRDVALTLPCRVGGDGVSHHLGGGQRRRGAGTGERGAQAGS